MAPLFLPFPPFPSPTSKQKGLDEGLERNGKQIVHLYLGGDQTLEQILSALFLRCSEVMFRCSAGEPERGEAQAITVNVSEAIRGVNDRLQDTPSEMLQKYIYNEYKKPRF